MAFWTTLAMVPALSLQAGAADSVLGGSEYTVEPEQWELSYDIAIQPYLEDYERCLGYGNRIFNGEPNVEQQHRADIPRCAAERETAVNRSNAALARRDRTDLMPPSDVEAAFAAFEQIHIARGRNLDAQFQLQLRAREAAQRRYAAQVAARGGALIDETEN